VVGFRFSGRLTQGPAVRATDRRHPLRLDMLTSTRSAYVQVRCAVVALWSGHHRRYAHRIRPASTKLDSFLPTSSDIAWLGATRRAVEPRCPRPSPSTPPPGSRTRHCPRHPTTWQRRQDGAQDTFLHSRLGSFTPCRWHQRRFAMPGATVNPAGTSGSLAGRTEGMVRRKAIPQPAVS
jgi:hypothetical protein